MPDLLPSKHRAAGEDRDERDLTLTRGYLVMSAPGTTLSRWPPVLFPDQLSNCRETSHSPGVQKHGPGLRAQLKQDLNSLLGEAI